MPEKFEECDLYAWIEKAEGITQKEFRQAVHTILAAIASDKNLQANMILKGGILLAVRYQSDRFTTDIDLSTNLTLSDGINPDKIKEWLNNSLAIIGESLDYGLDCKIQRVEIQPKRPDPTYPSINISVGHAYKGSTKHQKLLSGQCPTVVRIDYSLNEPTPNVDTVRLKCGNDLQVYSLIDLVAEKLRALLQQESRGRSRRQDIFDLNRLFETLGVFEMIEKRKILTSLIEKCRAREIEPNSYSFDDIEVRNHALAEYHLLGSEVEGDLPDFESSFSRVAEFYRSLPWQKK